MIRYFAQDTNITAILVWRWVCVLQRTRPVRTSQKIFYSLAADSSSYK